MTRPITVVGVAYPQPLDQPELRLAMRLQDGLEGLSFLNLCHLALNVPRLLARLHRDPKHDQELSWLAALRWGLFTNGDFAKPRFLELVESPARAALEQLKRQAIARPPGFADTLENATYQYRSAIERVIVAMNRQWRLQASLAGRASSLRYLYCDALLRSCMYAVSLPGVAMALIPLALLCYDTLHQFCVISGIDHSQLHRIESGTVSISLPRLRRIVETLHASHMQEALHIVFVGADEVYERLYSLPFVRPDYDASFAGAASSGRDSGYGFLEDLGTHWWSLLETRRLDVGDSTRIDVDHFRDAVLKWHRAGDYRYSESANLMQCDRSYLSRALRGESGGSVELFVTMAWAFGNGRLMIQADERRPAAEVPEDLLKLARPPVGAMDSKGESDGTQRR